MIRKRLLHTRRQLLSVKKWKLRLVLWGSAILIGATAASFALLGSLADQTFHSLHTEHQWLAYLATPLGLALVAFLTVRVFPGTQGSGIPQAIAALENRDTSIRHTVLSLRIAIGKILLATLGLLSGASIGREGPTVHIGASLMYSMRHFLTLRNQDLSRTLIMAGGAAGIAAAFNTPLAGIIFAIEELNRNYEQRTSGTLLLAVVIAGITAITILGNYTYFGNTGVILPLREAWVPILICGGLGGLLGGTFSSVLIMGARRLSSYATAHPVLLALYCGLAISLLGMLSGGTTYGTGYTEAKALITATSADALHYEFPFAKMLATIASYWSGIPGGIFAPSLAVGAGLGANLGAWLTSYPFPALVILGMAGYFTGVVQTPITALVIIMEMTSSPSLLLPLMATALLARAISSLVCPVPIYQALAENFMQKQPSEAKVSAT